MASSSSQRGLLGGPGGVVLGEAVDEHHRRSRALLIPGQVDVADPASVSHGRSPNSVSRSWCLRILPPAVVGMSSTMRSDSGQ